MRKQIVVVELSKAWPVINSAGWRSNKPAAHRFLGTVYGILYRAEQKPRWKKDILETVDAI